MSIIGQMQGFKPARRLERVAPMEVWKTRLGHLSRPVRRCLATLIAAPARSPTGEQLVWLSVRAVAELPPGKGRTRPGT
ncbi:MAG: hypothetical protein CMP23_04515 [Rickettsiales bacterium]|nr:hypothetical protein [Rickettsiales bacterium]